MKRVILFSLFAAFTVSCATKGEPVTFASACDVGNEKKTVEVSGVLDERGGSTFCSNTSGRMECNFSLLESAGSDKTISADVEEGSGANTVDKIGSSYKVSDIKMRDNNSNLIALGTDKVKVTGKMSIQAPLGNAQGVCFMQVYKIEK